MLPSTTMRILLVDDDPILRRALRQAMVQLGFGLIAEAGDGQEALEVLGGFRPELIVTDCQMPRMDGLRLTRALRASGITVPILMISAVGDERVISAAFAAGITRFIPKPAGLDELRTAMTELFGPLPKAA